MPYCYDSHNKCYDNPLISPPRLLMITVSYTFPKELYIHSYAGGSGRNIYIIYSARLECYDEGYDYALIHGHF